tara:strand:+ start:245 stop:439 length:195 start_codon:yes stop_codon:yes gene_type:complete
MRVEKSNFRVYSSLPKIGTLSRPVNIVDIVKKNKVEEKKEKIVKIYTLLGFVGLFLLIVTFIYL